MLIGNRVNRPRSSDSLLDQSAWSLDERLGSNSGDRAGDRCLLTKVARVVQKSERTIVIV